MLQVNQKKTSNRRLQANDSTERQTVINNIARDSVHLDVAIKELERQYENRTQDVKNHGTVFNNPILMVNLETTLIDAYRLRRSYDSELRVQSEDLK